MRKFDLTFRNDLRRKVEAIEAVSGVELVVAILPRAAGYWEYYLGAGLALMMVVFSVLMFAPMEIWYVMLYVYTVGAGIVGGGALWAFPGLLRTVVGQKGLQARCDLRVSATFSRAKIFETRERVGILLMVCWLERKVRFMPDKGVIDAIPPDELAALENKFLQIFDTKESAQSLLDLLDAARDLFAKYIPPDIHPINELPDELWIE